MKTLADKSNNYEKQVLGRGQQQNLEHYKSLDQMCAASTIESRTFSHREDGGKTNNFMATQPLATESHNTRSLSS